MEIIQLSFDDGKTCSLCGVYKPFFEYHRKGKYLFPYCKECSLEKARTWQRAHPERMRQNHHRYDEKHRAERNERGRLRQARDPRLTREWHDLCGQYGNKCLACGASGTLVPDHVIPLCKGGSYDMSNIQPLCHSCNSKKRDKIIDYR